MRGPQAWPRRRPGRDTDRPAAPDRRASSAAACARRPAAPTDWRRARRARAWRAAAATSISRRVCSSRRSRSAAACAAMRCSSAAISSAPRVLQRLDFAGQRLQLAIDLGELRRRRGFHVGGLDEILPDGGVPIAQVGGDRILEEPPEAAGENHEVDGRPEQPENMPCSSAACSSCACWVRRCGCVMLSRRGGGWCRVLRCLRGQRGCAPEAQHGHESRGEQSHTAHSTMDSHRGRGTRPEERSVDLVL